MLEHLDACLLFFLIYVYDITLAPGAASRLCAFTQTSPNVHSNMSQAGNGQMPDCGKPKGAFTGQRLARERPKVYRQVIALVAQGTSDSRIARLCRVSRNTVAALKQAEAQTIEQRKQTILATAARVAEPGFERIEEELAAGSITGVQLVPVADMSVDKVLALSGDPTIRIQHEHRHLHRHDHFADFNALLEKLPNRKPMEAEVVSGVELNPGMGLEGQSA